MLPSLSTTLAPGDEVIGVDFSGAMLTHGLEKVKKRILEFLAVRSLVQGVTGVAVGDATAATLDRRRVGGARLQISSGV